MNPLYQLSKLYAEEHISKSEYRRKRADLVNAILAGREPEEYSATFVPKAETVDEITQQPSSNDAQLATPSTPPKKQNPSHKRTVQTKLPLTNASSSKRIFWYALIAGVIGIALYVITALLSDPTGPQSRAGSDTIEVNVDEDPAMQELNTLWELVIVEKKITEQDRQQLTLIWHSAPENVKARFISDLKETIKLWENDFEREIETGLTTQLLATVESFPQ